MECPNSHYGNPPEAKFCGGCGHRLDLTCPECGTDNPAGNTFCNECGSNLKPLKAVLDQTAETKSLPVAPTREIMVEDTPDLTGERKHVTVLFSDLSGYSAMSERLDPEEVKEIVNPIFAQIKSVIVKYEGFIEKFAGDAVMAIFDVPRAIKAAREIHFTRPSLI